VTRVRTDAVAHEPAPVVPPGERRRGRPRQYGDKHKLAELFEDPSIQARTIPSPAHAERGVTLTVRDCTLLWRPAARLVRFVLVDHPERGRIMLLCTDRELGVEDIIRLYGLRFKIELGFKQASQVVGAFDSPLLDARQGAHRASLGGPVPAPHLGRLPGAGAREDARLPRAPVQGRRGTGADAVPVGVPRAAGVAFVRLVAAHDPGGHGTLGARGGHGPVERAARLSAELLPGVHPGEIRRRSSGPDAGWRSGHGSVRKVPTLKN